MRAGTGLEEWKRGWPTVLAAMAGIAFGVPMVINCAGLFVVVLQQETGWTRTAVSFGPMVGMLYALLLPIVGSRIERWGADRIGLVGLLALSAGLLFMAAAPLRPPFFYGCIIWLGIAGTMSCNVIFCRVVAPHFERSIGTAIAVVLTGVSLNAALAQPILARIIEGAGWRTAIATMGFASLLLGALPVFLVLYRRRPAVASAASTDDVQPSAGSGFTDPRFWFLSLLFAMAAAAIGGFVAQIQPIMLERGFSLEQAAGIAATFLVLTSVGRLLAGMLFDIMDPRWVAAGAFALSALGAVFLAADLVDPVAMLPVIAAVALVGLSQGAEGDFMALFTLRLFGVRRFAFLFACLNMIVALGFALGGLGFALCRDMTGHYRLAILGAAALLAISAIGCAIFRLPEAAKTANAKS